jgi:hypothetical protein
MNDEYLTLEIFRTLLAYNPNVDTAIENTKTVLADLFPVGVEDEPNLL